MAEPVGDFPVRIDALMAHAAAGGGPQTMDDIRRVAGDLAARLDSDPEVMVWLRDNAMPLIGQQLLVAAVQAVQDPAGAFGAALDECRGTLGVRADPATVIRRLVDFYPGAVRAWLVHDQLPRLIADQLRHDDGQPAGAP